LGEANETGKVYWKIEKRYWKCQRIQYNIRFQSASALDNFIADYPGTPYKEDALYYKFDSAYQLGINSVPQNGRAFECCKNSIFKLDEI
jgi:outer membrane protein assembly factor BamD